MPELTPTILVGAIEDIRFALSEVRDRVDELAAGADRAHLFNGRAIEAAAGGLTCVIATLAAGQEEVSRG